MPSKKKTKIFTTEVLKVYQKVNPSIHFILNKRDFKYREKVKLNLFENLLNFPKKMFKDEKILEFGSGTGDTSIYYSRWGAKLTGVEVNKEAIKRCKQIYKKYHKKRDFKFINQSLFDFKKKKLFDLVTADGVLHHTDDPKKGLKILCNSLKPNGYLIYGTNLSSGRFLRNLQRYILFKYSFKKFNKVNHHEIERLARKFFKNHLDRAEKFGNRSKKAIIYDDYINPKIKSFSLQDTLKMFQQNSLTVYSSWPPILLNSTGQSHNLADTKKNYLKNKNLIDKLDLNWSLTIFEDEKINELFDKNYKKFEKNLYTMKTIFEEFSNIDPYNFKRINPKKLGDVKQNLSLFKNQTIKDPNSENSLNLLKEINNLYKLLSLDASEERMSNFLNNTRYLFKGYCGIGINYFICRKNKK